MVIELLGYCNGLFWSNVSLFVVLADCSSGIRKYNFGQSVFSMVLTDSLGRHHSLSSQYAGFRDFDEPMRVVTPTTSCPADDGVSLFTPFGTAEQQGGEISVSENLWPRRGRNMREGEIVPFRSLSLGSYAWASSTPFEEVGSDLRSANGTQAVLEIDPDTDLKEKVINSSGSMVILQATYEATLKSLGLIDSEDEDRSIEDTDFLFSRWGFHNGRPSSIPHPDPIISNENLMGSSKVLSSKPGNKQQGKRWRILSANAKKLPSTISEKCQCMPWSWRRIRSWGRRRKEYSRVLGKF